MSRASARVVAVDLGASSGRVYAADVAADRLHVEEVRRFTNGAVALGDRLYWDVLGLYRETLTGLSDAGRERAVDSIGVDSWAVDYGLLRADGTLLSNPATYRDPRTAPAITRARDLVARDEMFARTGIAHQPFNTVFQLMTDAADGYLSDVDVALLIPDLMNYFLTGKKATEFTNASTTQLMNLAGTWDEGLFDAFGLSPSLFAPLVRPGHDLGPIRDALRFRDGALPHVINVASHDTATAVAAVPATSANFAYISCGTWSLVGVELERPVVSAEALKLGFSNERGVEDTYRVLHNVMGLWLLQECMRTWSRGGVALDVDDLSRRSASLPALRSVIDINDPVFLGPGDMPERIAAHCRRRGEPVPESPEEFTRCIMDSLAVAYRQAIERVEFLTGEPVDVVHLVGGGVKDRLLCQLTADACGRVVVAGPVEAAALGNIVQQARALGVLDGDRWALRQFVRENTELVTYEPDPATTAAFVARTASLSF